MFNQVNPTKKWGEKEKRDFADLEDTFLDDFMASSKSTIVDP